MLLVEPDALFIPPTSLADKPSLQALASKAPNAARLGGGVGVKSRSPLAGARSAGLEAGTVTQAQSFVSFGRDRSCTCRLSPLRPVVQVHVPAGGSCGVLPHQLISGRRALRPRTRNPRTWGSGLGKRDHSLATACRSPSWGRSRALDFGELIRPDRTSSSLGSHRAISLHTLLRSARRRLAEPRRRQTQPAFSMAPSGTTPSVT